jgi:rhodanese-related sulfurtransferase
VVLDVREPDEWAAGHVDGALHVPLGTLPLRLDEVPADATVLVVCRSGGRSAQATMWLEQQGREAVNLHGGMHAWAAAGRPMVSETGAPPAVL